MISIQQKWGKKRERERERERLSGKLSLRNYNPKVRQKHFGFITDSLTFLFSFLLLLLGKI